MAFPFRLVASATLALALAACSSSSSSSSNPASDASVADGCASCGDAGIPPPNVDASVCHAADLSSWSAPAYTRATGGSQGWCTPAQIQSFYDSCLGSNATQSLCALETKDNLCASCLVTGDNAPGYGPLILHGGLAIANFAGCVELLDPTNGLACAKGIQALLECELAACAANCPVKDDATLKLYDACVADADANECASYAASAQCLSSLGDAGAAAVAACDPSQSFDKAYFALAKVFCGAPSKDASPD
jgi:hypothetical protein